MNVFKQQIGFTKSPTKNDVIQQKEMSL